jgi:hypothetical protein
MRAEVPAGAGQAPGSRQMTESEAWSAPGVQVLLAGIGMALLAIVLLVLAFTLTTAGPGRSP